MSASFHTVFRFLRWLILGLLFVAIIFGVLSPKIPNLPWQPDDLSNFDQTLPAPEAKGFLGLWHMKAAYVLGRLPLVDLKGPLPKNVDVAEQIEYARIGSISLQLDLYRAKPFSEKPLPAIIFIHGGGWRAGNRSMYRLYASRFALKGFVTINISYRLSGQALFPAALEDVQTVIRWARKNAATYQIDPDRIGLAGGSAGGHLALLAGYLGDNPGVITKREFPEFSNSVQAIVDLYGPTDLTTPFCQTVPIVEKFLGTTFQEKPDLFKKASPVTWIGKDSPPTLIIHGTLDDVVPFEQANILASGLVTVGTPFELEAFPGWPHAMDAAITVNRRCEYLMYRFFSKHLKKD